MTEKVQPSTEIAKPPAPQMPAKATLRSRVVDLLVEAIAIAVWAYVLTEIFIFDVDAVLRSRLPGSFAWLIDFKFILVLAIAAAVACFIKRLWKPVIYVSLYPLVVIFWKIPFLILKQRSWALAIAFVNAVASFFGSIKYNLIVPAVFFAAASIVLFSSNVVAIWLSIGALFLLLVIAYGRRLVFVFKTPRVFRIYEKLAGWMPKIRSTTFSLDEKIKGRPYDQLSPEEAQKWKQSLLNSLLCSRGCLFLARKLRSYSNSGYAKISSAFICVFLTVATVLVFGLINMGLYKIDQSSYRTSGEPSAFTFLHYSFNRMIFNSIPELEAASVTAKLLYDAEAFFAFFLVVIFVSLLLSTRAERQTQQLNDAIKRLEAESTAMDLAITVEYSFDTVDTAVTALEKIESGTTSLLQILSRNL